MRNSASPRSTSLSLVCYYISIEPPFGSLLTGINEETTAVSDDSHIDRSYGQAYLNIDLCVVVRQYYDSESLTLSFNRVLQQFSCKNNRSMCDDIWVDNMSNDYTTVMFGDIIAKEVIMKHIFAIPLDHIVAASVAMKELDRCSQRFWQSLEKLPALRCLALVSP